MQQHRRYKNEVICTTGYVYVNVSSELIGMFANDLETGMLQNITAQGDSYHDHKQDMIG